MPIENDGENSEKELRLTSWIVSIRLGKEMK